MTHPPITSSTSELPDRDRRIVKLVATYGQVASTHIHDLLFPDVSRTPIDRALKRLVERGYLIRLERRLVGGARGGSGQYVYALGRRGFFIHFEGRFTPARSIRYHTLAIVDGVVMLRSLEREGRIVINGITAEPDCWVRVGSNELKPDLYVDFTRGGRRLLLWLEVDMGSEGQKQLRNKLERYWWAYNDASAEDWPVWPGVLWVAIDDERERELRWVIGQLPEDARRLFQVVELKNLPGVIA